MKKILGEKPDFGTAVKGPPGPERGTWGAKPGQEHLPGSSRCPSATPWPLLAWWFLKQAPPCACCGCPGPCHPSLYVAESCSQTFSMGSPPKRSPSEKDKQGEEKPGEKGTSNRKSQPEMIQELLCYSKIYPGWYFSGLRMPHWAKSVVEFLFLGITFTFLIAPNFIHYCRYIV